jgi:hypothetical protein
MVSWSLLQLQFHMSPELAEHTLSETLRAIVVRYSAVDQMLVRVLPCSINMQLQMLE